LVSTPAYVGLDIGKTKIACGLVGPQGKLFARAEVKTDLKGGAKSIMAQSRELIRKMFEIPSLRPTGIGIGSTGIVDSQEGRIIRSGSIADWKDIRLRDIFGKEFGVTVLVENDVNTAGLGEFFYGTGNHVATMVYISVSTGVGLCTIYNGKLSLGAHNLAGQIGHFELGEGTINSVLSGRGMADRASIDLGREVSTKELFEFASRGNPKAVEIIERAVSAGGLLISLIQLLIDPDLIIAGGGVINHQGSFFEALKENANKRLSRYASQFHRGIELRRSELGENAGILGATALFKSNRG
jgi:glucokinase